jgi:hypothetical protein
VVVVADLQERVDVEVVEFKEVGVTIEEEEEVEGDTRSINLLLIKVVISSNNKIIITKVGVTRHIMKEVDITIPEVVVEEITTNMIAETEECKVMVEIITLEPEIMTKDIIKGREITIIGSSGVVVVEGVEVGVEDTNLHTLACAHVIYYLTKIFSRCHWCIMLIDDSNISFGLLLSVIIPQR